MSALPSCRSCYNDMSLAIYIDQDRTRHILLQLQVQIMDELNQDRVFELQFHRNTYLLHLVVTPSSLAIDLEEKSSGDIWIGDFSSEKLEQNTQKTGNFKKYPVFVQMLIAAINNSNDSVELDLLTYQDLQQLKSKKSQAKTLVGTNKRYLMLNYIAQFDKVHYPLQLIYQDVPNAERMKLTVKRLRSELDIYRRGNVSGQEMVKENVFLRQQNQLFKSRIKKLQENESKRGESDKSRGERIVIKQVKDEGLQVENQQLKRALGQAQNKFQSTKSKVQSKQRQVTDLKSQLTKLRESVAHDGELRHLQTKRIEDKLCKEFNHQLESIGRETGGLVNDLKKSKEENKKLKSRVEDLEKELASIIKRNLSQSKMSSELNTKRSETPRSKSKSNLKNNFTQKSNSKRKSVVDSDTESSRLRRMTNRNTSPYRNSQVAKRTPLNKSVSKLSPQSNRSKSKSQRRQSPSLNNSQLLTESQQNFNVNFPSDSDSESNKIQEAIQMRKRVRQQKLKPANAKTQKTIRQTKPQSTYESQISKIADMLKKSRRQLQD